MMKFGAVSRYCQEEQRTIQLLLVNPVWGKLQLLKGLSNIILYLFFQICYLTGLLVIVVHHVCFILCAYSSYMRSFDF